MKYPTHIIVNYHYVEDPNPGRGGIWPCPVAEFERQIKFLSENYTFASTDDIFSASQADSPNSSTPLALVAFDDGLKGQYENAVPILERYGATAIFFPITSVWEGGVPGTHKLHVLLSKTSSEKLIDLFNNFSNEKIPKDKRVNKERRLFEDMLTANLKETLLVMPPDKKDAFLNRAFKFFGLDEKRIVPELFMSKEEVKKLAEKGFEIGSHAHGHYSLNSIDSAAALREIRLSKKILAEVVGKPPDAISYPHGRVNDDVIKILKNEGFKYGFTIENRALKKGDDPFRLPRLDTNDFKKMIDTMQIA